MMDGDDEDDEVAVLPPSSSSSPMKMKEQQPLPRWYRRFLRSAPLIASVRQGGRRATTAATATATAMTSNRNNSSGDVSGRRTTRDIKVTIRCNYMIVERKINDTLLENNDDEEVITRPGTNDEKNVMIRPEMTVSNNNTNSNAAECCTPCINKDEYALLHSRYLQPRTRTNVELPASGMILRKQTKCRWIDQYKELRILKIKIDTLLKNNEHTEVYHLLCQLRDWEMNPRCIPSAFIVRQQQQDTDEDVVTEILDLTNDEDDDNNRGSDCIDVDNECTTDTVLARPLDILSSSSITLHTPPPKQQMKQPSIRRQLTIEDCRDFYVQHQQQQQQQQQQEPKQLLFQTVDDDSIIAQPPSCVVTPEKDFARQKDEMVMNKIFLDTNLKKRKLHPCPTTEECKFSVIDFGFPNQCNTRKSGQKRKNHSTKIADSHALSSRQLPSTTIENFNEKLHHHVRPTCHSINIIPIPSVQQHAASYANPFKEAVSLRHQWNIQGKLRRRGEWIPNGHLTGQWKPPQWAITLNTHNVGEGDEYYSNNETNNNTPMKKMQKTKKKTNSGGSQCKKSLLPQLDSLMWMFTSEMRMSCNNFSCEDDGSPMHSCSSSTLRDVICPQYVKPTINVLCSAHSAMESLLPKGDCEEWEVVALAWRYYNHWRPSVTKVILLAESHAFTPKVSTICSVQCLIFC
jgi:hypothetical protein